MDDSAVITETVRRALREGPFAMRQLAADSGLSYDVLRSWRSGRRRPNPESVRKLADGLSRRSDALRELARELRRYVPQP
jgi:transcriptional regulator with XRE-family HTH domain